MGVPSAMAGESNTEYVRSLDVVNTYITQKD